MSRERIVVVGGGPAAAALVHGLSRGEHGGEVVVLSGEPDGAYDRTAVSKAALTTGATAVAPLFPEVLGPVTRTAEVASISPTTRTLSLTDGEEVGWDRLVLATGAAPWVPPVPGLDGPSTSTLRTAADAAALRGHLGPGRRLVVVGAGLIGLEVAGAARAAGADVVVLEAAPTALARVLPPALAGVLVQAHASAGVEVRLGATPTAVEPDGDRVRVTLSGGLEVTGDHVLVATGVRPRTALAEAAGLATDDGILVGELLTTSDLAISAIGDCARVRGPDGRTERTEAYTPAMSMGQHLARTLLGEASPWRDVPWGWSDQLDLTVQVLGWPSLATRWVLRGAADDLAAGLYAFGVDADGRLRAAAGVARGRAVGRVVRGAQAAVAAGLTVSEADLADPDVDLRRLASRTASRTSPSPTPTPDRSN